MTTMVDRRAALADVLFDIGAVKFGGFKLKLHETQPDAPLSPFYFNLRTRDNPKPGPLGSDVLATIGLLLRELVDNHGLSYTSMAGIPRAGDPFVDALAATIAPQPRVVRLHKYEEAGTRRIEPVEGSELEPGAHVLLVDDVVTHADTKLEAVRAVQALGGRVTDLVIVVDREQGGADQLGAAGCAVHSVYTLSELLGHYLATGRIDEPKAAEVLRYVQANR